MAVVCQLASPSRILRSQLKVIGMPPQQIRVLVLLIIAVTLCSVGAFTGGKTTRAASFAMIVCWLTVSSVELIAGPNFPFAFTADALYAIAMVAIGLWNGAKWPVYLVAAEAISLVLMFTLMDLTHSSPLLGDMGYIALVMSGPAFVFGRGLVERLSRRRNGHVSYTGLYGSKA